MNIKRIASLSLSVIKNEGFVNFLKIGSKFLYYKIFPDKKSIIMKDILFINGCTLPHPRRYRVNHQIEQLKSQGISCDEIFYEKLNISDLKRYRGFVFYRCPITETISEFIERAKFFNKTCFFDIDDLVIDTKYTNKIDYVSSMDRGDKELYDDGVNRMKKTMQLCDYAITSTTRLKKELDKYGLKEVFINRNTASDEMIMHSNDAVKQYNKTSEDIVIGYFSGSITHNENFEIVASDMLKILSEYPNVYLKIMGLLDIPDNFKEYRERIISVPFKDWRELPFEMIDCDIHIAPLKDSIFNQAKSENKWIEAALVKRPIVASNVGAFKESIINGETGILVDDNGWYKALKNLIDDPIKRQEIGDSAFKEVIKNNTTIATSFGLADFIRGKLSRNIGFMLPSTDISGGVIVVLKHADILRRCGWDVTILDGVSLSYLRKNRKKYNYRYEIPDYNIVLWNKTKSFKFFDTMVATLWSTVDLIKSYPNTKNRLYFVQNMETEFQTPGFGESRLLSNSTYGDFTGVRYITMSEWCQEWLKKRFNKESKYASNGIDLELYPFRKRNFKGKIKILIEGDSRSEYKNTDEAFRVVDKLDSDKFEIHYLSYRKEPKDWYRVDKFYNRIPPEEVGKVYAECDILLKTSILESFSYPPLEMMATGGVAVVVPNGGNAEYLINRKNCLLYEQGNIDDAVSCIEEILSNDKLRNELIENGIKTANSYKWSKKEADILKLYE